ncbi:MAG: hypothetical protein ACRD1L_08160 [Terriglobales bacterium]
MNRDEPNRKVEELLAAAPLEPAEVERAWGRFRARREADPLAGLGERGARRLAGWLALGAGIALVGSLGFSPSVRAATASVLALFRVEHIAVLPLDTAASPLADPTVSRMISELTRDEVKVTLNEHGQAAADAAQASQLAGFAVRYAPNWGAGGAAPSFRVQGAKTLQVTVDRERTQAVLSAAGIAGQLPASLDGAMVTVHVPRAVAVLYGECGKWAGPDAGPATAPPMSGNCTVLGEGPSPEVTTPPGLDIRQLAALDLQLLGLSPEQANEYLQTIDWTSTLVVPFPRGQAQPRQVGVDGADGVLLSRSRADGAGQYVLLWNRQGMLYFIAGRGDGSQGLQLADELTH